MKRGDVELRLFCFVFSQKMHYKPSDRFEWVTVTWMTGSSVKLLKVHRQDLILNEVTIV